MAKDTSASSRSGPTASDCAKMSLTCACHNLRRATRAVTQVYDSFFEEVGLKATQFTVLAALAWCEERHPTIGELAEILVLEQSSLSRNLTVLERLGLVRLVPGEQDRRERIVSLTRSGRAALIRGFPVWRKAQAAISATLDPGELDSQLRSLRRLTKSAQALRPACQAARGARRDRPPQALQTVGHPLGE